MKPRHWALVLVLAVATAVALLFGRQTGGPSTDAAPAATAAAPVAPTHSGPTVRQPDDHRPRPLPMLPPADAPLAQMLPALKAAADAGDRRAACRLSMELLRCQGLEVMEGFSNNMPDVEARLEAEGNLASANAIAELTLRQKERLLACRGVPVELRGQGARYLRQAALAGDSYAMLAYAEGQQWPPSSRGVALGRDFDVWRQEAPGMIHAALRSGNPTAAYMLHINYTDDSGFLSGLIPNDPYRAYVYHLLAARLFGQQERSVWARPLDAVQIERAREEAAALHRRYFNERSFPSAWALQFPPYVDQQRPDARASCQTDP